MELKADVKVTAKELFIFLMYHMYMNTSGIIYTVIAAAALAGGIYYFVQGNWRGIFLIAVCLIYFVVMPLFLYIKARTQSRNEVFQKSTQYTFKEDGLYAAQGSEESSCSWDQIRKVCCFAGVYLVYMSAVRANLIPVSAFNVPRKDVDSFLLKVMPKNRLKGIH